MVCVRVCAAYVLIEAIGSGLEAVIAIRGKSGWSYFEQQLYYM